MCAEPTDASVERGACRVPGGSQQSPDRNNKHRMESELPMNACQRRRLVAPAALSVGPQRQPLPFKALA